MDVRYHMRCVTTSSGGYCGGNAVEMVEDEPGGLLQPGPNEVPSYVTGGPGCARLFNSNPFS